MRNEFLIQNYTKWNFPQENRSINNGVTAIWTFCLGLLDAIFKINFQGVLVGQFSWFSAHSGGFFLLYPVDYMKLFLKEKKAKNWWNCDRGNGLSYYGQKPSAPGLVRCFPQWQAMTVLEPLCLQQWPDFFPNAATSRRKFPFCLNNSNFTVDLALWVAKRPEFERRSPIKKVH